MANYLSLEEAAAKLGIPAERLVELRSQGQVRGFRDGASWKFPDTEVDRLVDELPEIMADSGFGSGIMFDEKKSGSSIGSKGGAVIGADDKDSSDGSDLNIGSEATQPTGSGSDVNLTITPDESKGSDVALVASGSDAKSGSGPELLEVDSADMELAAPALGKDSGEIDIAGDIKLDPDTGSTGPITDKQLKSLTDEDAAKKPGSGSSVIGLDLEEDSGEVLIGSDSALDVLDAGPASGAGNASSLELMDELDLSKSQASDSGADVLGDLDLLSAEQAGSGLISGIGSGLVTGSDLGSGIGSDVSDALGDDSDLVIADDDDDLVIDSAGSDISVAGDSGINLMSPSDSGLSLESEPLDLAGSSISALDLGADLGSGVGSGAGSGSGSGSGFSAGDGTGSAIDFQADEEFQLSPSGIGLETDEDSGSQVIEVEDSEVAESVDFAGASFGDDEPFAEDAGVVDEPAALGDEDAMSLDTSDMMAPAAAAAGAVAYETPFSKWQLVALGFLACVMTICGMVVTDLVRNMWAYAEPSSPVSSLTEWLIAIFAR